MAKIAIIGAGSIVFCKTLLNDMLATEALDGSTYALMGPTLSKVQSMEKYGKQIIAKNNLRSEVYATTDRREALRGAKYVVLMLQIGGIEAIRQDYEIPYKYGVDQCIGDSMGPGGIFRAARTIPVLQAIADDILELCPDAYVLNYVNPMAMVCIALGRMGLTKTVGLCHGIQTTLDLISGYTNVPKNEIDFYCAGINHMAWFLKLEHKGRDLYPLLKENFEKPEYYINEKVRGEVMRHFGYFMTESTGHLSEYLPWFRKNRHVLDTYCDQPEFGGATGALYKFTIELGKKYSAVDYLQFESGELEPRSIEYCSYIVEAIETDRVFRMNGNVINQGYITNLPDRSCVEVPMYVDRHGFHPTVVGALPSPLAAMNQSNVSVQSLAVEAAMTGDPELLFSAIAMDPLTAAALSLKQIRDMTSELLEAQRELLPQFGGKSLRPTPSIATPANTVGVPVPLDPALAIANRFGKLATQKTD
ncbi:MAG: hypothetical protein K0Q59_1889 [Paenibacillus sp.]|nr:hypothetical protein [Paenibacillus sp.]